FSLLCVGSNFLPSSSKSRRPSLEAKIACSMLMVPTLVPETWAAAAAVAEGALGGLAAAGAPAAGGDWARANWARPNTTATVTRANLPITNVLVVNLPVVNLLIVNLNLLIIGSFELLRIFRKCWKLPARRTQRG